MCTASTRANRKCGSQAGMPSNGRRKIHGVIPSREEWRKTAPSSTRVDGAARPGTCMVDGAPARQLAATPDSDTATHANYSPQTCWAQSAPAKTALSICGASLGDWSRKTSPGCFRASNDEYGSGLQRPLHVAPHHCRSGKCRLLPNPQHVRHCGAPLE